MSDGRDDYIDGELAGDQLPAERRGGQVAHRRPAQPPANPLDATPEQFRQVVQQRHENYQALTEFLLANLREGHDFGKIHVKKRSECPDGNRCTNPWHWSGRELFAPGADTILSLLGLGAEYDGAEEYRQALLKGVKISDVMLTCHIVSGGGQVLAEGSGAASTGEHSGSFHNTLLKAQKRSRLAAVKRLPGVSSLFKDENMLTGTDMDRRAPPREDPGVERPQGNRYATGKALEVMPFGKHKGVPFSQLDGRYLTWVLENMTDKPDVIYSARLELDRRRLQEPGPDAEVSGNANPTIQVPDDDDDFFNDGPPPDAYFSR